MSASTEAAREHDVPAEYEEQLIERWAALTQAPSGEFRDHAPRTVLDRGDFRDPRGLLAEFSRARQGFTPPETSRAVLPRKDALDGEIVRSGGDELEGIVAWPPVGTLASIRTRVVMGKPRSLTARTERER